MPNEPWPDFFQGPQPYPPYPNRGAGELMYDDFKKFYRRLILEHFAQDLKNIFSEYTMAFTKENVIGTVMSRAQYSVEDDPYIGFFDFG